MINRKIYVEMTIQEFYDFLEYQKRGLAAVRMAKKLGNYLLEAIGTGDDEENDGYFKYAIVDQDELTEAIELAEKLEALLSTGEEA